jgi:hypothetical protein
MKEPRVWKNDSGKPFEFRYGGKLIIFEAGEVKPLDGEISYHIQVHVKGHPLQDVTGVHKSKEAYDTTEVTEETKEAAKTISWDALAWKDLVKAASALGIYKPGMSRRELLLELKK